MTNRFEKLKEEQEKLNEKQAGKMSGSAAYFKGRIAVQCLNYCNDHFDNKVHKYIFLKMSYLIITFK
jgi:hypothetical protein